MKTIIKAAPNDSERKRLKAEVMRKVDAVRLVQESVTASRTLNYSRSYLRNEIT